MNSGLFGRRCSPADADVLGHQLRIDVFAIPPVRCDKSTRSHPPYLASLRELDFTLRLVGPLLFLGVERVTDSRKRILLFRCKLLADAFRRRVRPPSIGSLGRRISLVKYVIDAAVDQRVLWLSWLSSPALYSPAAAPSQKFRLLITQLLLFSVSRWQPRTISANSTFRQSRPGARAQRHLARWGDQAVMPVVAVIQHTCAPLGGIDKEQERLTKQAQPVGRFLFGQTRNRLPANVHGQRVWAQLVC